MPTDNPAALKSKRLRDESTPEGRKIWADVDKAASLIGCCVCGGHTRECYEYRMNPPCVCGRRRQP